MRNAVLPERHWRLKSIRPFVRVIFGLFDRQFLGSVTRPPSFGLTSTSNWADQTNGQVELIYDDLSEFHRRQVGKIRFFENSAEYQPCKYRGHNRRNTFSHTR